MGALIRTLIVNSICCWYP